MARARITTTREIRPDQLKVELGGADVFTSEGICEAEGVTTAELQAAIDAHVPDPNFGKPTEDVALADELGQRLDQLETDLTTAWDALSAGERQAALRRAGILSIRIARYLRRRV